MAGQRQSRTPSAAAGAQRGGGRNINTPTTSSQNNTGANPDLDLIFPGIHDVGDSNSAMNEQLMQIRSGLGMNTG